MDEAYGILCLSISLESLFHVEACSTPKEIWTKFYGLFGKKDEMRGNILENKLIYVIPRNFETLHDYFSKFNTLLQHDKSCGIDRKEEQIILSIISKLGPEHFVFIYSFQITRIYMGISSFRWGISIYQRPFLLQCRMIARRTRRNQGILIT
jgi:hypothetical protein